VHWALSSLGDGGMANTGALISSKHTGQKRNNRAICGLKKD
jgi:hypothetical protein